MENDFNNFFEVVHPWAGEDLSLKIDERDQTTGCLSTECLFYFEYGNGTS